MAFLTFLLIFFADVRNTKNKITNNVNIINNNKHNASQNLRTDIQSHQINLTNSREEFCLVMSLSETGASQEKK